MTWGQGVTGVLTALIETSGVIRTVCVSVTLRLLLLEVWLRLG